MYFLCICTLNLCCKQLLISHNKTSFFSIHFEKCIPYKVDHDVNISSNAEPKRCPKVSVSGNKRVDVSGANELKSKNSEEEQQNTLCFKNSPCCPCGLRGTCAKACPCRKGKAKCFDCVPSTKERCSNYPQLKAISNEEIQIQPTSLSASQDYEMNNDSPTFTENQLSFVQQKMIQAYGVPLLNTEGEWTNDIWENIWKRIVALRGKLFTLPGGAISRNFFSTLAAEVLALSKGESKSEICICFPPLILQRDKNIGKTADIHRLISRRLDLWKQKRFLELISEAEMCNKMLPLNQIKMTDEKAIEIFTRLILNGKIRQATRFITESNGKWRSNDAK